MKQRNQLDTEISLKVMNDIHGHFLFTAIEDNDAKQLQILLDHGANMGVNVKKNGQICLEYAVKLERWDCVLTLIKNSYPYIRYYSVSDHNNHDNSHEIKKYLKRASHALFLAIKQDRKDLIQEIFKLLEKNNLYSNIKENILFYPRNSWWKSNGSLRLDTDTGYTILHWAVIKNTPKTCEFLASFAYPLFIAKDYKGLTAFDLAISMNHIACARQVAKGMSLSHIALNSSEEILLKSLFLNIKFDFNITLSNKFIKKQEIVFQYITKLPINQQKEYFTQATRVDSCLFDFFGQTYKKRILTQLTRINMMNTNNSSDETTTAYIKKRIHIVPTVHESKIHINNTEKHKVKNHKETNKIATVGIFSSSSSVQLYSHENTHQFSFKK